MSRASELLTKANEAMKEPEFKFLLPDSASVDKVEQLAKKVKKLIGQEGYTKVIDKKVYFVLPSHPFTSDQYKSIEKAIQEL